MRMPILNVIGSSLLSVGIFGLTTAINYAISGLVDWPIASSFIAGGLIGGVVGMRAALMLAKSRSMLTSVFAGVSFVVAVYMLGHTGGAMGSRFRGRSAVKATPRRKMAKSFLLKGVSVSQGLEFLRSV
jgi:uncharacterized membrane protein YfcA